MAARLRKEQREHRMWRNRLMTGAMASWLWHDLRRVDFPVACINTQYARLCPEKQSDAQGPARLVPVGLGVEKSKERENSEEWRVIVARSRLIAIRRDIENQVRSLIKERMLLFPHCHAR